ncbi:MAG: hypothetical protein J5877_04580 [Clostridia bacterium]|nr:hypothetical protein [Clostridia bacterium]
MNGLYSWALSFTVCSFIVLIINYLFPKGNVRKTATVVLVLFCLLSITEPLKQIKKIDLKTNEEIVTENENDITVSSVKTRIRLLTDEALKKAEINNYEIRIDISLNNEEIIINEFSVFIDNPQLTETAKNEIEKATGLTPEIHILETD